MVDEYGMGAFSMVVVENMELKDVQKLEEKFEDVDHVKDVLWYDDVADLNMPTSMIPKDLRENFFNGDATMMLVLFDDTTSSETSMNAVKEMRKIANKQCFISGMSGVVNDIKDIALAEMPMYVVVAACLSLLVLELAMDSFLVPVFFLLSIGFAILYNLGTNIFLGEVSYITKALAAVLQLGVTMDYSIFLLNSYEELKEHYDDRTEAMGNAIATTFKAISSSSVTTIAGFAALCFMTFALGRDLGIVMAKGVILGLICCVTVLPSMILIFDKQIEKTKHKPFIRRTEKISDFFIKHHWIWIGIFVVTLLPAMYGNNHTDVYYNIASSLPSSLPCNVAGDKLDEDFGMSTIHMVMLDKDMDSKDKTKMLDKIDDVDGVEWSISLNSLVGPTVPSSMIPEDLTSIFQSDNTELVFVCSEYKSATDEVNAQIKQINKIVKDYDKTGMVIGEAPLMNDLQDVTDVDIQNVNIVSVAAIFIIILFTFKSISLPVILVAVIEFAIALNMAVPYFQGESLPFVASIVVGSIQLGATVDYAIVFTTRYQRERMAGQSKMDAVRISHRTNMMSIITSALSLFAATYGVALYSSADMIGSICTLLSRGALISMVVVLTLLPALFLIFDKVICKTTIGMTKLTDRKDVAESHIISQ